MTYPPSNPGYPAPQQPGGYGAPAGPAYPAPPAGPSKLPGYLIAGVVLLGVAAYLASFGPLLSINTDIGPFGGAQFTASGLSYWTMAALLAALLAAVSMLPKSRSYTPIIAVAAVMGVLLVIGQVVNRPAGFSVGWALWLVLGFTLLQAVAAVAALLLESGVLTAPAPRPQYPQYGQYGPPPAGYYGQPGQPAQPGQQRPGYPTPYPGGYAQPDANTDTPPTGFPSQTPSQQQPQPTEPSPEQ
ncbi:MAG: DUF5336 domain-containing protein [Mycobacterium sp.]